MKSEQKVVEISERVDDHQALLEELAEENRQLRLAATAFGQLAERLNEELRRAKAQRFWVRELRRS
jgi:hypothetical protein